MKELHTEIEINATPERVWRVLTSFAAYPDWNPFVIRAEGEGRVGARLRVSIKPPGETTMSFRPRVLVADPDREFRWKGSLWIPGLFDGEHAFVIEGLGNGRVRFIQSERFQGLLVPLLWKKLNTNVRFGFEEMNRALKSRAESAESPKSNWRP